MAQKAANRLRILVSDKLIGADNRLDKFLPACFPELSRRVWRDLIDSGAVKRNDDTTRVAGKALLSGDVVELHLGKVGAHLGSKSPLSGTPAANIPMVRVIDDETSLSPAELEAMILESASSANWGQAQVAESASGPDSKLPFSVPGICSSPPRLDVLHSDKRLLVINKPGGMLCQSAEDRGTRLSRENARAGTATKTVDAASSSQSASATLRSLAYSGMPLVDQAAWWVAHTSGRVEFLHMYHRLDRVASGAVLFVRSRALLPHIDEAWDAGGVTRTYLAVVQGVPRWGTKIARAPIGRAPGTSAWKFAETLTGKPARTVLKVIAAGRDFSVVECAPQTGRTHQIRVHLAALGHPIVGDVLYGADTARWPLMHGGARGGGGSAGSSASESSGSGAGYEHRVLLHSHRLAFEAPIRHATLSVEAPLPGDMASYVHAAAPIMDEADSSSFEGRGRRVGGTDLNDESLDDEDDGRSARQAPSSMRSRTVGSRDASAGQKQFEFAP